MSKERDHTSLPSSSPGGGGWEKEECTFYSMSILKHSY